MKKILSKLLGGALLFGLTMSLTSCEDILGHWEKPTPNPITPPSGGETPTVEDVIKYGFKVTDLNGDDKTTLVNSLKMSTDDGPIAEAEVSGGKITIEAEKLSGITSAIDFWFEAEIDGKPYIAKVNIDPATLSPESDKTLEMATLGDVILSDGKFAATSSTGTKVAMIAYLGSDTYDATFKKGLAIALDDEGSMDWSTAMSTCGAKSAITGAKWCLPSQDQWKQMFKANGGNNASCTGLNTAITTAGGTTLQNNYYWSSSEGGSVPAWRFYSGSGGWELHNKGLGSRVRACLAF